jgi:hypothetical protein
MKPMCLACLVCLVVVLGCGRSSIEPQAPADDSASLVKSGERLFDLPTLNKHNSFRRFDLTGVRSISLRDANGTLRAVEDPRIFYDGGDVVLIVAGDTSFWITLK